MEKRGQAMLITVILLLGLLIGKSLWFDPVGELDTEKDLYKNFALEIAPMQNTSLLQKWGMLTYRVMFVLKEENEGTTDIMYENPATEEWVKETLEGQYRAKVRAYLLQVIPMKDIQIKGGVQEWNQN